MIRTYLTFININYYFVFQLDKKSELHKYGIYYDDGYDYMQHLKERSNQGELVMVSNPPVTKTVSIYLKARYLL